MQPASSEVRNDTKVVKIKVSHLYFVLKNYLLVHIQIATKFFKHTDMFPKKHITITQYLCFTVVFKDRVIFNHHHKSHAKVDAKSVNICVSKHQEHTNHVTHWNKTPSTPWTWTSRCFDFSMAFRQPAVFKVHFSGIILLISCILSSSTSWFYIKQITLCLVLSLSIVTGRGRGCSQERQEE